MLTLGSNTKGIHVSKLRDVKEVVDVAAEGDANNYLNLGWRLIRTYVRNSPNTARNDRNEVIHYVLGWVVSPYVVAGLDEGSDSRKAPHPTIVNGRYRTDESA